MSLTKDDVKHIANLAKLRFAEDELNEFATKLADIVQFVDQLREVDMDGIEPMAHPLDRVQRLREDVISEPVDRDTCQLNASHVSDGLYLVPRVLE